MYIYSGKFSHSVAFTRRLSVRKLELQILNTCSMYDKDVYKLKHAKFLNATVKFSTLENFLVYQLRLVY